MNIQYRPRPPLIEKRFGNNQGGCVNSLPKFGGLND